MYLRETKEVASAQGEGSSWLTLFLPGSFSGEGRDIVRIGLEKEGAGAAASSLVLDLGGGRLELLLEGGNSLPPLEPSPVLLLLTWGEPLLVRAATELGPY